MIIMSRRNKHRHIDAERTVAEAMKQVPVCCVHCTCMCVFILMLCVLYVFIVNVLFTAHLMYICLCIGERNLKYYLKYLVNIFYNKKSENNHCRKKHLTHKTKSEYLNGYANVCNSDEGLL